MRFRLICFIVLFATTFRANSQTIRGTVVDAQTQLPVAGATITAGSRGADTDTLGRFTVTANVGTVLKISHVNYESRTYTVAPTDHDNIYIYLDVDDSKRAMNTVVVQGFTKRSKALTTGSTTVITADDIKDVPAASLADLLQGKVAGVNIQSTSGQPGARGSIFQRGLSSITTTGDGNNLSLASTQPLFIIDGVPIDPNEDTEYGLSQAGPGANPLTLIPSEDVESIEILKDAASTAVYGSRGAYGVWIINTKRGRSAVPKVSYDGKVFLTTVPALRDLYGGRMEREIKVNQIINFNDLESEVVGNAIVNNNPWLADSLNPYINNSTDWQSYFYNPKWNHSHNLRFSGGNPGFNYKVNMNYYDEQGIIKNTGFTKYSAGMNAQYENPNKKFKTMMAINATNQRSRRGSGVGLLQTGVANSGMAATILPPPNIYTENNDALAAFNLKDDNKINNISTNLDLNYEILKGLRFFTTGSMNFTTETYNIFYPSWLNSGTSQYNSFGKNTNSYYNRNMLQYAWSLGKEQAHNFSVYGFTDLVIKNSKTDFSMLRRTPNDIISGPYGYNLSSSVFGTLGNPQDLRQFGYGGNFSYNYMQKYVFEGSYRMDGSSLNGPLTGYNPNPMLSARWNIHREKFMEKYPWVDNSSIRGSWGRQIVPEGDIFRVYGRYFPSGSYLGQPTVLLDFGNSPNSFYKPTTTTQTNLAYEGGFLKGRIGVVYEYYYRVVNNMTRYIFIPRETGYSAFPSNDISMVNSGHELTLNLRPLSPKSKLSWILTLTGAYNKNVLTRLPNNAREIINNPGDQLNLPLLYRLGRSSFTNYLYNTKGVYASDADVPIDPNTGLRTRINGVQLQGGDPIFADLNGDYIIDSRDLVAVGDPVPKVTGGLNNTFKYGQFTLDINTYFTLFRDVLNTPLAYKFQQFYTPDETSLTAMKAVPPISEYNYWQQAGDNAMYPNPYTYLHNRSIGSFRYNQTLFMEDGSYWKLQSVILGYSFGPKVLRRLKFDALRVYISGRNLFVLTNYSGPNPENVSDLGRDNPYGYPNPRVYNFGVTATF